MRKFLAIILAASCLLLATVAQPGGVTDISGFSIQLTSATTSDLRAISDAIAEQQGFKRVGAESYDVDDGSDRIPVAEYRRRDAIFYLARYRKPAGCVLVEFYAWGRGGELKVNAVREQLYARFSLEIASGAMMFRHAACGHAL
jgi:hypothetical protein